MEENEKIIYDVNHVDSVLIRKESVAGNVAIFEIVTGEDFRTTKIGEEDKYAILNYSMYILQGLNIGIGAHGFLHDVEIHSPDLESETKKFDAWETVEAAKEKLLSEESIAREGLQKLSAASEGYKFTLYSYREYLKTLALIQNLSFINNLPNGTTLDILRKRYPYINKDENGLSMALRTSKHLNDKSK